MKTLFLSLFGHRFAGPTLRQGFERYLSEVSPEKKNGAPQEASQVRSWLKTDYADWSLAKITGREVAAQRDIWMQTHAPATVLRRLALLSHLYTMCITEWQYRKLENPVKQIRKPKVRNSRTRRIFNDIDVPGHPTSELDWIVRNSKSPRLRLAAKLAVETAMRRSEIAGLTVGDIDFEKRTVFIPDTKNGEERTVPLSPRAIELLSDYRWDEPEVRVVKCSPGALTRAYNRALQMARAEYERECEVQGIVPDPKHFTNLRFHDLRHEAISSMAPHFHAHELARISGHKDTRMLMRYYHPDPSYLASRLAEI